MNIDNFETIKIEEGQNILFLSDTHYGHSGKEFLWGPRGFRDSEEHDRCITDSARHMIYGDNTIIFHLGDIAVGKNHEESARRYLPWLCQNVKKLYHILGNHDSTNKLHLYQDILGDKYECLGYQAIIAYKKWRFVLNHMPLHINNFEAESKKFCLCGHSHTQDKWKDIQFGCYHCELDAQNCYPVSLERIIEELNAEKCRKNQLKGE